MTITHAIDLLSELSDSASDEFGYSNSHIVAEEQYVCLETDCEQVADEASSLQGCSVTTSSHDKYLFSIKVDVDNVPSRQPR